jgi:hypothetical protein
MPAEDVPGVQEPLGQLHVNPPPGEEPPDPLHGPGLGDVEPDRQNPHVRHQRRDPVKLQVEPPPVLSAPLKPEATEEVESGLHHRRSSGRLAEQLLMM